MSKSDRASFFIEQHLCKNKSLSRSLIPQSLDNDIEH